MREESGRRSWVKSPASTLGKPTRLPAGWRREHETVATVIGIETYFKTHRTHFPHGDL
jgi:hypothetical protein